MEPVTVTVRLRDGGEETITVDRIKERNLNLKGSLVHPFEGPRGSVLYILEDGNGEVFKSEKDNIGISLPHYITGKKNTFGYRSDDIFDVRQSNFVPTKNRSKLIG